MSRIRDKLKLLHKPLSTPRTDVENFPSKNGAEPAGVPESGLGARDKNVQGDTESKAAIMRSSVPHEHDRHGISVARESQRGRSQSQRQSKQQPASENSGIVSEPVTLSDEMRARLDRLMTVAAKEPSAPRAKRGESTTSVPDGAVLPSGEPALSANSPDIPVRASGGFTVSRRAFERWRKERVNGTLPSPVVVRNKIETVRELKAVSVKPQSSAAKATRQQRDKQRHVRREAPRSRGQVRESNSLTVDPVISESVGPQCELDSGDRRYFDTVARLAHLSVDQAIRQVLDALELGVSRAVKVHAFRTLAKLSEDAGSSQYAIAAYDSLSTLCPDDPLPHRELFRLYRGQPDGLRRARYHVVRAAELAPWDGRLQRLRATMRGDDPTNDDTPFDS